MKKQALFKHYLIAAFVTLVSLFQAPFIEADSLKLRPHVYAALMFLAGIAKWVAACIDHTALDDAEAAAVKTP